MGRYARSYENLFSLWQKRTGSREAQADVMVPLKLAPQLPLMEPMKPNGLIRDALGHSTERYTATLNLCNQLRRTTLTLSRPMNDPQLNNFTNLYDADVRVFDIGTQAF